MENAKTVGIWNGDKLIYRVKVWPNGGTTVGSLPEVSDVDIDPWAGNVVDSSKPFNPVINFREG
jgi:hypothetical protein